MDQSQKPKPGDLIEISHGAYQHWAVYVGDGDVVHVTSPPGVSGESSSRLRSAPNKKAMVRRQKLQEAVGDNKWRINNILDKKIKPHPAHIIVEEALAQVDNVMEYSVTRKNCEHFATKLRYGKAVSWQVIKAEVVAVATAPLFWPVVAFMGLPVAAVAVAVLFRRL